MATTTEKGLPGQPRTTAVKSTQSARKVSGMVKKFYADLAEAAQRGEPIAWSMDGGAGAGPYEIRRSLGLHSVYPEHYATVCSAKQAGLPFMERAEGEGFANFTCSYARIGLGFASMLRERGDVPPEAPWGGMPRPTVLLGRGTCDAGLNWFLAYTRYVRAPLHIFGTMRTSTDLNYQDEGTQRRYLDYFMGQIRSLVAFLEKHLDRKVDWHKVSEFMARRYRAKWLWYQVNELRKAVPCPMPSGDKFTCMFPSHYLMGTQEAVDFYQELHNEIRERVGRKVGVIPNERYRLLFVGIPQWHNMAFFNALEEAGAVFVTETNYYIERPAEVDLNDPIRGLGQRYWLEHAEEVRRAREEGVNHLKAALVLRLAREYQVDGVVFHQVYSCRPNAIGTTFMKELLQERLRVPAFFLESDICDARVTSETENKARAEAFLETVARYKEARGQG